MKIFTLEIVTLLLLFAVFGKIKPMSKIFLFSSFLFQPPSEHIDPKVAIPSLHRKNLMIPIASVSRVKRRRNTTTTNLVNTNELLQLVAKNVANRNDGTESKVKQRKITLNSHLWPL